MIPVDTVLATRARAHAARLMTDTCTITRVTGTTIAGNGDTTPTTSTVYTGPCRVRSRQTQDRMVERGGDDVGVGDLVVSVPIAATGIEPGDLVTITSVDLRPRRGRSPNDRPRRRARLPGHGAAPLPARRCGDAVRFDVSDVNRYSAHLQHTGDPHQRRGSSDRGGRRPQRQGRVPPPHLRPRARTRVPVLDRVPLLNARGLGVVSADIGPDKSKPQGALGNILEYGTVNNAPFAHLGPALDREAPGFTKAISRRRRPGPVGTTERPHSGRGHRCTRGRPRRQPGRVRIRPTGGGPQADGTFRAYALVFPCSTVLAVGQPPTRTPTQRRRFRSLQHRTERP